MKNNTKIALALAAIGLAPGLALATNGMNMEGYGAMAFGMGGASMAYDNGTAAMMNNPATMALMPEGTRLDLAFGFLGPDVKSSAGGSTSRSSADAFSMPAFGWIRKTGPWLYGAGIYGQGGMGAEFGSTSMFANPGRQNPSPNLINRSEVSLGRVILPLAYQVKPNLSIGGSLDFVWAGMDMQMAMSGNDFFRMASGASAVGAATGSMVNAFQGMIGPGAGQLNPANPVNWGYFNFSNDNKYTGQATTNGYAGKIGVVYKINAKTTLGATYHSRTWLKDLQADQATIAFSTNFNGLAAAQTIPVSGSIRIQNFQWPDTIGVGIAYEASERWLWVADYKRINWANTMKDVRMTFSASGNTGGAAAFNGSSMDVTFYQDWRDQHVLMAGVSYKAGDKLTLRGGINVANNPVPDARLNYLFPATTKNHVTLGAGYVFDKASSLDFAYSHAFEVTNVSGATGVTTDHEQNNWQLVYSYRY